MNCGSVQTTGLLVVILLMLVVGAGCLSDPAQVTVGTEGVDAGEDAADAGQDGDAGDCEALTCEELELECGQYTNNCGDPIDCGDCPFGNCEQGQCSCVSASEDDLFEEHCGPNSCGQIMVTDRCDESMRAVNCGSCPDGQECGLEEPNICSCIPLDCEDLNASCGTHPDGCGSTVECDQCGEGESCRRLAEHDSSSETQNRPWQCTTGGCEGVESCEEAEAQCGLISDGCGGVLDCDQCESAGELTWVDEGEPYFCCDEDGESCTCQNQIETQIVCSSNQCRAEPTGQHRVVESGCSACEPAECAGEFGECKSPEGDVCAYEGLRSKTCEVIACMDGVCGVTGETYEETIECSRNTDDEPCGDQLNSFCDDEICICDAIEEDLCDFHGLSCGSHTVDNGCGSPVSVDCGGCGVRFCNSDGLCCGIFGCN